MEALMHLRHFMPGGRQGKWIYGAFKSCQIHRIYELNAHDATTKSLLRVGTSKFSELGACQ